MEIAAENLIGVLSDPEQRGRLQRAIDSEHGNGLPLTNRYAEVARACAATPEQLHAVIRAMLLARRRYRRLLCGLVWHSNIADETLFLLYEKGCCLTELCHRAGPQHLLERIARERRCSEAITTLALRYYSRPEYPVEAFATFLQEHADDVMLRSNITRYAGLGPDKQEAVRRIFFAAGAAYLIR